MSSPSFDLFWSIAKQAGYTLEQAQIAYKEETGDTPIFQNAPKREDYRAAAIEFGLTEDEADDDYDKLFRFGMGEAVARAAKRSGGNIIQNVSAFARAMAGGTDPGAVERWGHEVAASNFSSPGATPFTAEDGTFNWEVLKDPQTLIEGIAEQAPVLGGQIGLGAAAGRVAQSLVPPVAKPAAKLAGRLAGFGAAGAAPEAGGQFLQAEQEGITDPERLRQIALQNFGGVAALNLLPGAALLGGRGGALARGLAGGASEAATESAEEVLGEYTIRPEEGVQAAYQRAIPAIHQVAPIAALTGGLMGGVMGAGQQPELGAPPPPVVAPPPPQVAGGVTQPIEREVGRPDESPVVARALQDEVPRVTAAVQAGQLSQEEGLQILQRVEARAQAQAAQQATQPAQTPTPRPTVAPLPLSDLEVFSALESANDVLQPLSARLEGDRLREEVLSRARPEPLTDAQRGVIDRAEALSRTQAPMVEPAPGQRFGLIRSADGGVALIEETPVGARQVARFDTPQQGLAALASLERPADVPDPAVAERVAEMDDVVLRNANVPGDLLGEMQSLVERLNRGEITPEDFLAHTQPIMRAAQTPFANGARAMGVSAPVISAQPEAIQATLEESLAPMTLAWQTTQRQVPNRLMNEVANVGTEEQLYLQTVIGDLRKMGAPEELLYGVTLAKHPNVNGRPMASFRPVSRVLSVREDVLEGGMAFMDDPGTQTTLRLFVAHELWHGADFDSNTLSATDLSEEFRIELPEEFTGPAATVFGAPAARRKVPRWALGNVIREMEEVWSNNVAGMGEYLNYPFARLESVYQSGDTSPTGGTRWVAFEAFAQLGALYTVHPELVEQHMPAGYKLMREISDAISGAAGAVEVNHAVRASLSNPGPRGSAQRAARERIIGTPVGRTPGRGTGPRAPPVRGERRAAVDEVEEPQLGPEHEVPLVPDEAALAEVGIDQDEGGIQTRVTTQSGGFRINARGDFSGAPPGINSDEAMERLIAKVVGHAEDKYAQGPESFYWYERSAEAIMEISNGNRQIAEKLIRLMALYSQANNVQANTTAAVRSLYEYLNGNKAPLAGRFPSTTAPKIDAILSAKRITQGIPGMEDKIVSFYRNIRDSAFGLNEFERESTIDRWMMRHFGYETDSPTSAMYAFGKDLLEQVTGEYNLRHGTNLLPRNIQAALWVYERNKSDERKAKEKGKAFKLPETHDFSNEIARATHLVTWEVIPSTAFGTGIEALPAAQRRKFTNRGRALIASRRKDRLAEAIGIPLYLGRQGTGLFEGQINPNIISGLVGTKIPDLLKKPNKEGKRPLKYDSSLADLYSLAIQYIYRQDGVPWFRPDPKVTGPWAAHGVAMRFGSPQTQAALGRVKRALTDAFGEGIGFTQTKPNEIVVINFRGVVEKNRPKKSFVGPMGGAVRPTLTPDKEFLSVMETIANDLGAVDAGTFRTEGNYHEHDWTKDPEGKAIEAQIVAAGRSDLLPWLRGRRAAFDALVGEFTPGDVELGIREGGGRDLADADTVMEEATTPPEKIISPVQGKTLLQQARDFKRLGRENEKLVKPILRRIDRELNTTSGTNFKKVATIIAKTRRPEVLKKKPWFSVAHVRDGFRFKTAINRVSDVTRAMQLLRKAGITIVKTDTEKFLNPGIWGWRIIVFDLRLPNGQIVEYYLPLKELENVKHTNHLIFEKWRDEDMGAVKGAARVELEADIEESFARYQRAFEAAMVRNNQSESAVRAELNNLLASLSPASKKSSSISTAEGAPSTHLPFSSRIAQKPLSMTKARLLSRDTPAKAIRITSRKIIPETELGVDVGGATVTGASIHDPLPVYAASINLTKLNSSEDVLQTINQMAKDHRDLINDQRRNVQDWGTTERLAESLGMTAREYLRTRPGTAFNAEELEFSRSLMEASARELRVRGIRAAETRSDADQLAFAEAYNRHLLIQSVHSGLATEAGRALNILRKRSSDVNAVREVLESLGGKESIDDIARLVAEAETVGELTKAARDTYKPKFSDIILEAWINALLSGPQTHAVNTLSNTLVGQLSAAEHYVAAFIGKLHGGDKVTFREANAYAMGGIQSAREGLRMARVAFTTEEPSDPLTKLEVRKYRSISSEHLPGGRTTDALGRIIRIPGRALMAEDEFFKAAGRRRMLNALAVRQALKEGLSGGELVDRMRELVANPPGWMMKMAKERAGYLTFTNRLGEFGQAVQSLAAAHPILRVIMPFIRTPTNIVKFAAARSPFGLLMKDIRGQVFGKDKVDRDVALARMILGSSIGAYVASLALEGLITGGGPDDPNRRNVMYASGWQPYSIRVGDEWVAYSRLEPLGMLFGVSADMVELSKWMDEDENANVAALLTGSISKNLTSKTWLRGLSEAINALHDPDRYGANYIRNLVGTVVPTGVAQIARINDPMLRDSRSILDRIDTRIPGRGGKVPPKLDIWGNHILLEGGVGPDILSPIYSSKLKGDPATQLLLGIKHFPGKPGRKIGGVELNQRQYYDYSKYAGEVAYKIMSRLAMSQQFRSMTPFQQKEISRKVFNAARRLARLRTLSQYPDLKAKVLQGRVQTARLKAGL